MAAERKDSDPALYLTPLPETTRGFGKLLNVAKKTGNIAYGTGKTVVVRNLNNPSVGFQFYGHQANVNVAAFSPNGEWIASGDAEGTVLVWSVFNHNIKTTVPFCSSVLDIAWDGDGKRICAVGNGKQDRAKVFMWDSGSTLGKIDGHVKSILSCAYKTTRPYRIATASEDLSVKFYAGPPFKFQHTCSNEHERYPNLIRYAPNGETFCTVGSDSKILIFDGKTGEKIRSVESADGHKGSAIYSFCWSPDSKKILTASADKTCKLWNLDDDSVEKTFTFAEAPGVFDMQVGVCWHEDNLVSLSLSGALNFLDVENPAAPKLRLQGSKTSIQDLSVDKANQQFYTCDMDGKLTQFSVATGEAAWFAGQGHKDKTIIACAVNADSTKVTTVALDDKICFSDIATKTFGDAVDLGGRPNGLAAGNTDAGLAAVVLAQDAIVICRDGAVVSKLDVGYTPLCVCISHDDSRVAVGGKDKKIHVYDCSGDECKEVAVYAKHARDITCVEYSSDGKYLTSTGKDKFIYHWNTADGEIMNSTGWGFHSQTVNQGAWSPDCTRYASCGQDESFLIWNDFVAFKHGRKTFAGAHKSGVFRAQWADNETLVTIGNDRSIKVWKV